MTVPKPEKVTGWLDTDQVFHKTEASAQDAKRIMLGVSVKIYLDDDRPTPEGWTRCYWPQEVIEHLKTGTVTHLSLDHDLGDDDRGKGIHVIDWLKEAVNDGFENYPLSIRIHSDNGPGRQYMEQGIISLNRLIATRKQPQHQENSDVT